MKRKNEDSAIEMLSDEDITRFIEKPTPVESFFLVGGNILELMFDRLLKTDRKPEDIKKFMITIKHLRNSHEINLWRLQKRFFDLIYSMDNRSEHSAMVVEFLNVFFNDDMFRSEILWWEYPKLNFIFESCQKEGFRLISQMGQCGFISAKRAVSTFTWNTKNLIFLLISGVSFDFSLDAFTRAKADFIIHNDRRFHLSVGDNKSLISENLTREDLLQVMFRTMLTFQIYYTADSMSVSKIENIRYFWISIPDPFLIKEDFDGIFSGLNFDYDGACQSWYANEFKLSADWTRRPRSLRHISRCAIRRRLAECFQLPNIETLPLPKELHSYLNWSNLEDIY